MRTSVRRIALALAALMALSGVWLTWASAAAGRSYRSDPRNARTNEGAFVSGAGRIITADGVVVAEDAPNGARRYPFEDRYAHLIGYAAESGRRGIEESRFAALRLRSDPSITDWLLGLGSAGGRMPDDVVLTILDPLQSAAQRGLGSDTGAVVLIDLSTGAVLAYASSPSYDPNRVVAGSLDPEEAVEELLDRVADRVLPPGSTFKILVAAAALEAGADPTTAFPDAAEYLAPDAGSPIGNAGGGFCNDGDDLTLALALTVSCNTVFARLAVTLGGSAVVTAARTAGFDAAIPWETGAVRSSVGSATLLASDPGALAQTGIGERDVRVTPLLMALIAAAVGNDGVAMRPYVVDRIDTADGVTVRRTPPTSLARMFSAGIATQLFEMMRAVVTDGTGGGAAVDGLVVAGKTGTAEGSGGPHAWFVGVAGEDEPEVAIAVLVESAGSGGRVAAPIARQVFEAWLELRAES
ncbi:MAG TPA: penicillin-binding transpeptidase domain-containing protein [Acidimicrobiia bacterium]|nr:penicillin-binding transpeptidase domain-containing protein [Acidimicrobiia bacterium]